MRLRLGQPVSATDGVFGVLGDIVVDPTKQEVTHIVAEPDHRHYQARLVPIWLVSEQHEGLLVSLDLAHLRRLERVSFTDYQRFGQSIDLGNKWDIGTEDILYVPYLEPDFGMYFESEGVTINYDRIPKGDCEIRRASGVVSSDKERLGHVEGLTADDDHVTAVVVQCGVRGLRHNVLVPLGSVSKVRNDRIELSITEAEFDALPTSNIFGEPAGSRSTLHKLQKKARRSIAPALDWVGRRRDKSRQGHDRSDGDWRTLFGGPADKSQH